MDEGVGRQLPGRAEREIPTRAGRVPRRASTRSTSSPDSPSGLASVAGQAISKHRGIGKVSFTGGTAVGRKIVETAAKKNLKRVTLELGGKNPKIVFDDADFEQTIESGPQAVTCMRHLFSYGVEFLC